MKPIQPTPSQAAVVLKKFLQENSIEMPLGTLQEGVARMYGYPSWNVLTKDIPARGPRSESKQRLPGAPAQSSAAELLRLNYFEEKSLALEEVDDADEQKLRALHAELADALNSSASLRSFKQQHGRGELAYEERTPFLQVSFDQKVSERFITELVFTLRNHVMACYVRTWEIRDGLDPSRDYGIFDESSGDFDTDAKQPDRAQSLQVLIESAVTGAASHRESLKNKVNVS